DDTPARTTIVKDLATGKDLLRRENGSGARALSPDGSLLLYDDRPVQVIDVATGRVLKTLDVGALGHIWTGFGPSGTTAYLAGEDASLTAWDASSGSLVFRLPAVGVGQAAIGRQGRVAVSDEGGHEVLLVDATHRSDGGSADTCAGFSYARQLDVTAGVAAYSTDCGDPEQVGRSTLHVVDLTDMSVRLRKRDGDGQDIGLAPDGRSVATITRHGSIVDPLAIYDTTDGRLLVRMAGLCRYDADKMDRDLPAEQVGPSCDTFPKTPFPWYPRNVSYSPDGRFLASVSGSLAVWDAATGRLLLATEDPRDATSVIFTRDSGQAIVSGNCEVVVYSTDTWRVARRAKVDANVEACDRMGLIGFTPAGRLIALSGVGGEGGGWLHRFDGATLAVISSNAAHDGSPRAYAMNSDGTRVVTGAGDGVVRVWDSETGNLVEQLDVAGPAQGVAFVGNDKVAVTPSSGGMLLFELDRVTLLKTIKASIIRGFSPEECERFGFGRDCPTLGTLRDSSAP
ncbi:MAG: WD40 repeat domain-containing protein, partial [Chloroflexota bacterium]